MQHGGARGGAEQLLRWASLKQCSRHRSRQYVLMKASRPTLSARYDAVEFAQTANCAALHADGNIMLCIVIELAFGEYVWHLAGDAGAGKLCTRQN